MTTTVSSLLPLQDKKFNQIYFSKQDIFLLTTFLPSDFKSSQADYYTNWQHHISYMSPRSQILTKGLEIKKSQTHLYLVQKHNDANDWKIISWRRRNMVYHNHQAVPTL